MIRPDIHMMQYLFKSYLETANDNEPSTFPIIESESKTRRSRDNDLLKPSNINDNELKVSDKIIRSFSLLIY